MAKPLCGGAIVQVHPVHLMNTDSAPGGPDPQTKSTNLNCESECIWLLSATSIIALFIT